MSDPRDDLDPELAALYAAERASPLPSGASTRVLAGALATITAAGVAGAAGGAAGAVASNATGAVGAVTASSAAGAAAAGAFSIKAVVAIAIASAIAGGAGVAGYVHLTAPASPEARPPAREPMPAPDRPATPTSDASATGDVPTLDAPAAPITPTLDAPTAPASAASPPGAPAGALVPPSPARAAPHTAAPHTAPSPPAPDPAAIPPLAAGDTREPLLIDHARIALRRGLIDEALATLMRHERLHPSGAFAEERDVLVIEAYAGRHDAAIARRRIDRYRRDYPSGFLRARVDAAEATLTP